MEAVSDSGAAEGGRDMSERQEKKRRYNQRLEYIAAFQKWLDREPSLFRIVAWHKWKKARPVWAEEGE